jgi:RNA polymerase sigma factor (sigma-70 family)
VHLRAYVDLIPPPSFISESSSLEKPRFNPGQPDWTDDEIAAIRIVLKKLTAVRIFNLNDAEDLVQDTLLTMITKHRGTVLEKGPLAWGLGILRKKVGNYYRKAQRYASLNEQDVGKRPCRTIATPEGTLFHEELKTIVDATLSQLPASQRQALELMMAGFNAGEIAKQLYPVRYQNVINSLYRGRKKLAVELAKYGYAPNAKNAMRKMKKSRGTKRGF